MDFFWLKKSSNTDENFPPLCNHCGRIYLCSNFLGNMLGGIFEIRRMS